MLDNNALSSIGLANVMVAFIFGYIAALLYICDKNLWPVIATPVLTTYLWHG